MEVDVGPPAAGARLCGSETPSGFRLFSMFQSWDRTSGSSSTSRGLVRVADLHPLPLGEPSVRATAVSPCGDDRDLLPGIRPGAFRTTSTRVTQPSALRACRPDLDPTA